MPYGECKIYFDGSHYIAIPHTTRPSFRRSKPPEEEIVVEDTDGGTDRGDELSADEDNRIQVEENARFEDSDASSSHVEQKTTRRTRTMTRKELFEELYMKYQSESRKNKIRLIMQDMIPYFKTEKQAEEYVLRNIERKLRNIVCRRVRMTRKVNMQEFNYFCTFTYSGELHTEESFKRKLQGCFKMMCHRKGWKYVGVWERSPEKQRLHFHGLFYIPDGMMPGELVEVKDYSPIKKKVQTTIQNTYFNKRFGRSDFKAVEDRSVLGEAIAYLTKYMEKTGEKIVYSKGLPQFFISDVMEEDVVCPIGLEDKKLLLYDDFGCWDEGCFVGKVSKAVIAQMRKHN